MMVALEIHSIGYLPQSFDIKKILALIPADTYLAVMYNNRLISACAVPMHTQIGKAHNAPAMEKSHWIKVYR